MMPLERAARALCESLGISADARNGGDPFVMDPNSAGGGPRNVVVMLEHVRAVLAAIREPHGEHLEAGGKVLWAGSRVEADRLATKVWQAMIEAALAGEPIVPQEAERSHQPGGFQTKVVR